MVVAALDAESDACSSWFPPPDYSFPFPQHPLTCASINICAAAQGIRQGNWSSKKKQLLFFQVSFQAEQLTCGGLLESWCCRIRRWGWDRTEINETLFNKKKTHTHKWSDIADQCEDRDINDIKEKLPLNSLGKTGETSEAQQPMDEREKGKKAKLVRHRYIAM